MKPLVRSCLSLAALVATLTAALPVALVAQRPVPRPAPQRPTSQRPAAAVTPTAADTGTSRYEVDGVRVIHRRTTTSLFVANLYLLGGVRLASFETAGLEPMLLEVTERGTRRYPGEKLRRAMIRTGSEIGVAPHEDWTLFGLRTTKDRVDSTWSIFTDRVMHPTLDSADVEFVRESRVSGIAQREDSPDAYLEYLADSVAFAGHPYGISPVGTVASLSRITANELRAFHRVQMVKSRMLLVIVGDLPRARVERLVRSTLGTLPLGDYQWSVPAAPTSREGGRVAIVRRPLPTNYIQGFWAGPPAGHPDVPALRVASAVLSGRLFSEIRSRRNLTYSVSAPFRDRGLISGGLYVTTTQPDTVLGLMKAEIRDLQTLTIETEALGPLIQQFITEYFLDNETTGAQADFLARAELYRGDFRAGDKFVAELRAVTGEDIRRVAAQWMKEIRFAYVGDPAKVNRFRLISF